MCLTEKELNTVNSFWVLREVLLSMWAISVLISSFIEKKLKRIFSTISLCLLNCHLRFVPQVNAALHSFFHNTKYILPFLYLLNMIKHCHNSFTPFGIFLIQANTFSKRVSNLVTKGVIWLPNLFAELEDIKQSLMIDELFIFSVSVR